MKRLIIVAFLLASFGNAFSLEKKFGSGFYEFESSSKNTSAKELPISSYSNGSFVFLRGDSAFKAIPQLSLDLDTLEACPEIQSLGLEGTFAFDEATGKIYFVKKLSDEGTSLYQGSLKNGSFSSVSKMNIKGVMAEKNRVQGSTLTAARYNFSHPGIKGFHNPCLAKDGSRIYFSGDFKAGKGLRDLWYIDKEDDNLWSRPKAVECASANDSINTQSREDFPYVLGDTALYFASDRKGGKGGLDLWVAHKAKNDSLWGKPKNMGDVFNSSAADYNIASNKLSMYFLSDRTGGKGSDDIFAPFRFPASPLAELPTQSTIEEPKGFKWVLMFFDFNKVDMKPEYEVQLGELISAMNEFPGESFRIDGYTDNRGAADYNLKLSQRRAEYIKNLLVQRGIPASSLKAVGHGMEDPVIPNAKEEFEHEQNRRVEISLLISND